jgi:exopolysaccharide biosynthesis polyprenyl glycosylphosphotransferase
MFRRFSVNYALFSMLMDGMMVCAALLAATHLRPGLDFIPFAAEYPAFVPTPWIIYLVFAVEWVLIALLLSVYDGRRNLRPVNEFTHLSLAALLATVALAGTLYLSYRMVSRLLFLAFICLAYLGTLGWRSGAGLLLRWRNNHQVGRRRVLIVGSGPVGRDLAEQLGRYPNLGLNVVGFLDDNPRKRNEAADIIGALADASRIVRERQVDDVIIALPQSAYLRMEWLIEEMHTLAVKVWVIPDYFRLALHRASVDEFAGIPMLDLRAPALNDYQRLVKRAFDILVALLSMPVALPLMGIIGLAIRLEGEGPVLLRQKRAGENGRIFDMYKFRTMVPNAEQLQPLVEAHDEEGALIHKRANDPRVTRLGRLLRRTSLDELPQLFNVLKGEMSMVGPRPELPYLVEHYEPWQRQRFVVPQGITGWWQINGRSDKPMHLNTESDLYYVQNYSLLLDIYILIKTIGVVVRGKGAF